MAKTVDQFSTLEDFRQKYNTLAVDVGDKTGLRTTNTSTVIDALNSLEDKSFFFQEFVYTATAAQTTFTGNDVFGHTLLLRKDRSQVFKNGVLLLESTDYNVTNADAAGNFANMVLTSGASAGDKIVIYAFTGSYLGTQAAVGGSAGFFTETASKTIYNTNDDGVILNGDGSPNQTTALQSGYTIQLAGKTYSEDDMLFANNKSVTTSGSGRFVGDLNGNADTVTNGVYLTATQTVTNKSMSGASNTFTAIPNSALSNNTTTVGNTSIALGGTATTITGLSSVTSTNFVGDITGDVTGNVTGNTSGSAGTVSSITAHSLQNLANVSASATPSDGQVLSWNNSTSKWTNTNPAATFTQADARGAISGGDGLSYNNSTGVMSANTSNGIEINSDNIELDYETVSSAPSSVGSTATGHLWFVI
jgi:hypothetical protein